MESLCPALSPFIAPGNVVPKVASSYRDLHLTKTKSAMFGSSSLQIQCYRPFAGLSPRSFHANCAALTSTSETEVDKVEDTGVTNDNGCLLAPNSFESQRREEGSIPQSNILISSTDSSLFAPPPEWKDWQERKKEEEMRTSQGITIRRRPPTGPPQHYVGPFEFRIQNEGNTPQNKLEEIIWNKDLEVTQAKEKRPLKSILQALPSAPPPRDFVGALRRRAAETNVPALIAEVKKASPSRGVIQPNFDPVCIAQAYERGGAACISVLTDSKYFQGDFEYLKRVRNAGVQCPLLCKEFIIDAWQLYFARLHGADAVLLIAAVLPDQDLKYMSKICKKLGIVALVEVHNTQELDRVLGIDGIDLIGINNRDLETFKVDINNTVELLRGERGERIRERNILVVGESGLFTPHDIALLQNAGVNAVLVGESLVKQDDPIAGIADLFGKDLSLSMQAELPVGA